MNKTLNCFLLIASTFAVIQFLSCYEKNDKAVWPPALPGADKNGVATIGTPDLLLMPQSVRKIIDSNPGINLSVAKNAPLIELVYHNDLPDKGPEYIGWTSYGDICLAGDGKVYTGIGNHWGVKGRMLCVLLGSIEKTGKKSRRSWAGDQAREKRSAFFQTSCTHH